MDFIKYHHDPRNCPGEFSIQPAKRKTGYASILLALLTLFSLNRASQGATTTLTPKIATIRPTHHGNHSATQRPSPVAASFASSPRPTLAVTTTIAPRISNTTVTRAAAEVFQCTSFRQTFGGKMGFDSAQVPRRPINGDHLSICSQGSTCCSRDMEHKLSLFAKQDYDRFLNEHINRFKALLVSRTTKFDDFFTELIRNARHNLHAMFIRTYGPLYEKNAAIFTELFDDLERYYRGNRGHVNLQTTMHRFFTQLFQKMFALLNGQYTFDQAQLQCVARHMDKVKPFGDVADKLSLQVKRAFTDARTFVQAMAIGRDTARTASEVSITSPCTNSLTKMIYCPQCRGLTDLKPCPSYCLSVIKSCLNQHMEMEHEWNQFIDALLLMAERLRSPFNIEAVVTPIDVKISEAIMNLQEQGENISAKIFTDCGKPRLSRRAAASSANALRGHGSSHRTSGSAHPTVPAAAAMNLEQLSKDVKEKLGQTRDFWSGLPSQICTDYGKTFKTPIEDDCWNGSTKSKMASSLSESTSSGNAARTTKSTDSGELTKVTSTAIAQQIQQLKLVTLKLKQAYHGQDVEWIETVSDDEDEPQAQSSEITENGSGGSGNGGDDVDVVDETEEQPDVDEGSGISPTIVAVSPVTVIVQVSLASTTKTPLKIVTPDDIDFDISTTTTKPRPPADLSFITSTTPKIKIDPKPLPPAKTPVPPPKVQSSAPSLPAAGKSAVFGLLFFIVFVADWR